MGRGHGPRARARARARAHLAQVVVPCLALLLLEGRVARVVELAPHVQAVARQQVRASVALDSQRIVRVDLAARHSWVEALKDVPGVEQAHVGGCDLCSPIVRLLPLAVEVVQEPERTCLTNTSRVLGSGGRVGAREGVESGGEEGASQRAYVRYLSEFTARSSYSLSGASTKANIS